VEFPDQLNVIDPDYLMSVDINNLLVQEVTFQQEILVLFGEGAQNRSFLEPQSTSATTFQVFNARHSHALAARVLEHERLDVVGVNRGRNGKFANTPQRVTCSIGHCDAHEGGDARRMTSQPCHRYSNPTAARGPLGQIKIAKWLEGRGNLLTILDFPANGKHTANIGPTIDTTGICFADDA